MMDTPTPKPPSEPHDFIRDLGLLALGSRLRRLSDRIMSDGIAIYKDRGLGFEPRWFPLFRLLVEHGPLAVGDAASRLGVSHAAVSQTAAALSKRGLIKSAKDRRDERRRVLSPTPKARELLPGLGETWQDIEDAIGHIADATGTDVLSTLEGLEHALDAQGLADRVQGLRRRRAYDAVEIVEFEPRLAEYFQSLNIEWLEKYFVVEPIDRKVLGDPHGEIIKPGGSVFFARVDGQIVGTCALIKQDDTFELSKMAVTERYQGRQIGKRLLAHAIEVAKEAGVPRLFLITNSSLTPAVTLYRRLGFKVTHAGKHAKYDRGDLTMELRLRGDPA